MRPFRGYSVANYPLNFTDPTGHFIYAETYLLTNDDPTQDGYQVHPAYSDGNGNFGNTYFLGPQDAQAIYGVSTPMRVPMHYLTDPSGIGKYWGLGSLLTIQGMGQAGSTTGPAPSETAPSDAPTVPRSSAPIGNHYPAGSPARLEQQGPSRAERVMQQLEGLGEPLRFPTQDGGVGLRWRDGGGTFQLRLGEHPIPGSHGQPVRHLNVDYGGRPIMHKEY